MDKFCIFCGCKVKDKTKEHVIPQWVMKLTGNPNRMANFSHHFDSVGKLEFAFKSFQFPACNICNGNYSKLEDRVKIIVSKILESKEITSLELNDFFDWLDKVRVGLWLGYIYLTKNPADLKPKFYINDRVGLYDRALHVYKVQDNAKLIQFSGANTPLFYLAPNCFMITINNYLFINMSKEFLLSRRLGFPYPDKIYWEYVMGKGLVNSFDENKFSSGSGKIKKPIINKHVIPGGMYFYQPIFKESLRAADQKIKVAYDNDYVKSNCLKYENGVGKIFYNNISSNSVTIFDKGKIEPIKIYDRKFLINKVAYETYEFQNYLLSTSIRDYSEEFVDKKKFKEIKEVYMKYINHNEEMQAKLYKKNKDIWFK